MTPTHSTAGLRGDTAGIEVKTATTKKYKLQSLLYWVIMDSW